MRFTHIILAYFVIGAVMWGGGAIAWDEAGLGQLFIDDPGPDTQVNEETREDLENAEGPLQQAAKTLSGTPLLAIWDLIVKVFGLLFWPITVLASNNAPPRVVVLLGGVPTVAFYGATIRLIRSSA